MPKRFSIAPLDGDDTKTEVTMRMHYPHPSKFTMPAPMPDIIAALHDLFSDADSKIVDVNDVQVQRMRDNIRITIGPVTFTLETAMAVQFAVEI